MGRERVDVVGREWVCEGGRGKGGRKVSRERKKEKGREEGNDERGQIN